MSVFTYALALLGRREHSRRELVDKLGRHGADATDIEAALENLRERGLQSDPRFAELLVRSRIAQGHGPIRLLAELRQHGIDETVARQAIDAQSPDWPALAAMLCARRFRGAPASHAERVKRANFLARRGFPPAIARDVSTGDGGSWEDSF
jgi:regulatory protein